MKTNQTYKVEYDIFMDKYKKGVTDGEEIGRMVARMVQYFADVNNNLCDAETALCAMHKEIEDEASSSTKAKVLVAATEEARIVRELKTDLKNVDQYINALKTFQKGALNEYAHMANT